MKIAFYHYFWPHLLKDKQEIFKNKISEYLVIYNLIKSLEKKGYQIIKYSKIPPSPYRSDKNIFVFRSNISQIIELIKFIFKPPDYLGLVSKSIYNSKTLVPLIRFICRIRNIKFLIFMGHDESQTSLEVLKNVTTYKYREDLFWKSKEEINRRLKTNESYRPGSKNEYVVVPSTVIRENCIKEGWPSNNIIVLPHGVDTDFFKPSSLKKNNGKIKILFAGNGATRKGLPYLLRAYKKLQTEYPTELTILSHNVKDIQISGITILKDINNNELLELYQAHDIFVLPSLLDGWGLTVSEAMSCGLPVIISSLVGIKDIIKNKKNGYIIKPKNSTEIYLLLEYLLNNPKDRKKIGQNARQTATDLSWNIVGDMFIKNLKRIQ